eukprot:UN03796
MSIIIAFVLCCLFLIPCSSVVSDTNSISNISIQSTTIAPLIPTTTEYNLCNNFTSCGECMNANDIDTHNIECSWIEHTTNNNTYNCIETNKCFDDDIECCTSLVCCNCLSQPNCIKCGSQGLNVSCLWDHTNTKCFTPNHTCAEHEKCLDNPSLLECEYSRDGACSFYFTTTSFWTLGYCGMLIFFICLPCCLYHKCGIDWDSEFSLMSIANQNVQNNYDQLQPQNDGYIFKGGAHITGR